MKTQKFIDNEKLWIYNEVQITKLKDEFKNENNKIHIEKMEDQYKEEDEGHWKDKKKTK